MKLAVKGVEALNNAAAEIIAFAGAERIWLFEGEMGAGKTSLIKALCAQLGVEETVQSPTYSIVNEYQSLRHTIYHFDFYRLKSEEEAMDIGYEEYFYSDALCFIEWPSRIRGLLPGQYLEIAITIVNEDERSIEVKKYE